MDPEHAGPIRQFRPVVKPAADREERIREEVDRESVRREARRRVDAEERRLETVPEILSLRELISRPEPSIEWRIEGWQPIGARAVFAAPQKAGKTTLVGALTRSLVDGDSWLGRFRAHAIVGNVAIIDTEMAASQLRRWLRDQRILADERVTVAPLRGMAASFNILDADVRGRWAGWFRERQVGYVVLDCLRPVLDALGLDEHRDIGRFLVAFDALLHGAGIGEALVVHHFGHTSERSRGDSRIRDWPDAEWRIVRLGEDPASPRYISAYGRDVDVRECQLTYDPATRRITIGDGSRRDAVTRAALADVIAVLTEAKEPLSIRGIEKETAGRGHSRRAIAAAIAAGIRKQEIVVEPGPKRALLHRLPTQSASGPECATSAPGHSDSDSAPVRHHRKSGAHKHTRDRSAATRGGRRRAAAN